MEIFRGETEILEQEAGSLVKISYQIIEVVVRLTISHVLDNRNGWPALEFYQMTLEAFTRGRN